MPRTLKLLIAAAAMSFIATSAHAVTFHTDPSINTEPFVGLLDFGEVVIGDTKTIRLNISWALGVGESHNSTPTFMTGSDSSYEAKYVSVDVSNQCLAQGGASVASGLCYVDLLFTPSVLGISEGSSLAILNLYVLVPDQGTTRHWYYSVNTTGEGINPVPLPAALPLLGGALSLLGFFGWRRNRGLLPVQ